MEWFWAGLLGGLGYAVSGLIVIVGLVVLFGLVSYLVNR